MHGFHLLVDIVAGVPIKDTQCGFKLFNRSITCPIFANQHLMRWAFDVELLYMAGQLRIPMVEVPVHWVEIPGSKVSLIESAVTMFRDLIAIRVCYATGMWKIRPWQDIHRMLQVHK
jgi:dolichyl-phosphate beta-glucosyltransferase